MRQRAAFLGLTAVALLTIAACGGDDDSSSATTASRAPTAPATSAGTPHTTASGAALRAGEPFPKSRCDENKSAGKIRYLSGFDFAATASIIDVVMAKQKGYYDDLCLDVELQPGFSTSNYPIVAGGDAEFASGGSFSEVVDYATANKVNLVALDVEGRTAIDSLIVKPGQASTLADLKGKTIGVKGKIPASVAAMLAGAGLIEGRDYQTVLLDGFDPVAHYHLDGIVGFPGYKSNEPGTLDRAGLKYTLFDPTKFGVPGSFGIIFSRKDWVQAHPTAAEDFLRATMKGLQDALADPTGATKTAIDLVEAHGNPSYLSLEGETYRWTTDSQILKTETPDGTGVGIPDVEQLQNELDAYAKVGLFGGKAPDAAQFTNGAPLADVYDGATVIWPAS
jgi:ABC-type nitrate/sulfonate/bicarbonate transport system substrate-binding protein